MAERRAFTLWVAVSAIVSVLCYTQAFFLLRYEVRERSTCDMPLPHLSPPPANATGSCWHPPAFQRAVIIIFDGMRYDFLAWNHSLSASKARYYQNKMPFVRHLVEERSEHTFVFRFISDAPTTTSQRLKGMWTGALPTFLDLKDNFNSAAIDEDNVLAQMHARGMRELVFMGGDTWDMLFPHRFVRSHALPSFNVKDLHTVDDGIERHLGPELARAHGEWDALFVHFEGVDHVGHRHGPDHPAMHAKLSQMDAVVQRVVTALANDSSTLLLLMSDHGMTEEGNHGGASDEELASVLLIYSPRAINAPLAGIISSPSTLRFAHARAVPQVDLVPSLSLLLGLPIPYASLGALIPELFIGMPLAPHTDAPPPLAHLPPATRHIVRARLEALNWALHINTRQVWRYLTHYSATHRPLPLDALASRFNALMQRMNANAHVEDQERLCADMREFLTDATALCRALWTAFDEPLMLASSFLAFLLLIALFLLATSHPSHTPISFPLRVTLIVSASVALPVAFLRPSMLLVVPAIVSACVVLYTLAHTSYALLISPEWVNANSVSLALALALHGVGLFSNSYIEAEHAVLLHLLAFLGTTRFLATANASALTSVFLLRCGAYVPSEGRHEALSTSLPLYSIAFAVLAPLLLALASINLVSHFLPPPPPHSSPHPRRLRASMHILVSVLFIAAYVSCASHHVMQLAYAVDTLQPIMRTLFPRLLYASLIVLACLSRHMPALFAALIPLPLVLLLLGPHAPLQVLCLALQLWLESASVVTDTSREKASLEVGIRLALVSCAYFYSTGHAPAISALQMESAYYGLSDYHWLASSLLVFANTFSPILLTALALPLIACMRDLSHARLVQGFTLTFLLRCACTMVFVFGARRHLMVWRIFAPKFLFDASFLLVALTAALLAPSALAPTRLKHL